MESHSGRKGPETEHPGRPAGAVRSVCFYVSFPLHLVLCHIVHWSQTESVFLQFCIPTGASLCFWKMFKSPTGILSQARMYFIFLRFQSMHMDKRYSGERWCLLDQHLVSSCSRWTPRPFMVLQHPFCWTVVRGSIACNSCH